MKAKKYACTDCGQLKLSSPKALVCVACDASWDAHCRVEDSVREAHWEASHKCRGCGRGLPLARYFKCEYCSPKETEDRFDAGPDCDAEMHQFTPTPAVMATAVLKAGEKLCFHCRELKPLSDYFKRSTAKGGLSARCKPCHREYKKEASA